MTSTPVVLLLLRSGQSSDRPSGISIQAGQLALDFGAADPGLYFEDSAGNLGKIGPPSYGPTAPNSSPVGAAGNYQGELWTDNSTGSGFLKVWDGASFTHMNVNFANQADTARFAQNAAGVTLASGAISASGTISASGVISASGAIFASGAFSAITASGTPIASGALGVILASGSLGAITASGTPLASGALGALTASGTPIASGALGVVLASGALGSTTASGTPIASGSLGAILASGSLGAITASGSPIASGALFASGVDAGAFISISGLPAASLAGSGALYYNAIPSGTQGSGLFIRVYDDWVQLF